MTWHDNFTFFFFLFCRIFVYSQQPLDGPINNQIQKLNEQLFYSSLKKQPNKQANKCIWTLCKYIL